MFIDLVDLLNRVDLLVNVKRVLQWLCITCLLNILATDCPCHSAELSLPTNRLKEATATKQ